MSIRFETGQTRYVCDHCGATIEIEKAPGQTASALVQDIAHTCSTCSIEASASAQSGAMAGWRFEGVSKDVKKQ